MNDWRVKSVDLMPLEKVWREIVASIHLNEKFVFNCEDLWRTVSKMCYLLVKEQFIVKIIQSLPQILNSMENEW
jgi:hypothetical protein